MRPAFYGAETHELRGNILGPKITPGDRFLVRYDIQRAKHGIPEALPLLYLTVPSYDRAGSFAIECAIHAEKLTQHVEQELSIRIEKAATATADTSSQSS